MEVTDSLYGPRDLNLGKVILEDQGKNGKPSLKQKTFPENNEKRQKKTDDTYIGTTISMGSISFSV